jgi:hypothetical protein
MQVSAETGITPVVSRHSKAPAQAVMRNIQFRRWLWNWVWMTPPLVDRRAAKLETRLFLADRPGLFFGWNVIARSAFRRCRDVSKTPATKARTEHHPQTVLPSGPTAL